MANKKNARKVKVQDEGQVVVVKSRKGKLAPVPPPVVVIHREPPAPRSSAPAPVVEMVTSAPVVEVPPLAPPVVNVAPVIRAAGPGEPPRPPAGAGPGRWVWVPSKVAVVKPPRLALADMPYSLRINLMDEKAVSLAAVRDLCSGGGVFWL
jgi:hypothetical protein